MPRASRIAAIVWLLGWSAACGQDWAEEMFDHTSHDFGTVARGAEVKHRFTVENIYEEDAYISAIRSSCGCTTPKITKRELKTWEKAEIEAVVDTRGYTGQKSATLTVVFTKPFPAEVRLQVHTFIRGDVVFQPGVARFGSVIQGTGAQTKVRVSYAGRADWRILSVESHNPYIEAQAVEVSRNSGQVEYDLTVTLKPDAPLGYINEAVVLVTNDYRPRNTRVPLVVQGMVASSLTARPSPLLMGVVSAGQTVTRRLVVQGADPFRVLATRCEDSRFKVTVSEDEAQKNHLLSVTFEADESEGLVDTTIQIETDTGGGATLDVPVHINVMPAGP